VKVTFEVRFETQAGEQAQVDSGLAGRPTGKAASVADSAKDLAPRATQAEPTNAFGPPSRPKTNGNISVAFAC
jgi:hypothetical protein